MFFLICNPGWEGYSVYCFNTREKLDEWIKNEEAKAEWSDLEKLQEKKVIDSIVIIEGNIIKNEGGLEPIL
jgi:hypothetical protein